MKMRLKPLRGQTYTTTQGAEVIFLEKTLGEESARVLFNEHPHTMFMRDLILPTIDTKDYEKIPDEKHYGH